MRSMGRLLRKELLVSHTFADVLLLADIAIPGGVTETVNGDVYTYTTSSIKYLLSVVIGVLLLGGGIAGFAVRGMRSRYNVILFGLLSLLGGFMLFMNVMTRGNAIIVTPQFLESNHMGRTKRIEYADLDGIEFYTRRIRKNEVLHVVFHMTDGTDHLYTGREMDTAARRAGTFLERPAQPVAPQPGINPAPTPPPVASGPAPAPQPAPPQPVAASRRPSHKAFPQRDARLEPTPRMADRNTTAPAKRFGPEHTAGNDAARDRARPENPLPAAPVKRQSTNEPATDRSTNKPSDTAQRVTDSTPLQIGMLLIVESTGSLYPVEVLELDKSGQVKIHYVDWSDTWDELVPRSRLWVEPAELAKGTARQAADGADPSDNSTPNAMRTWEDSSGSFKVEAKLLGFENGKVRLGRKQGGEVSVPIAQLSDADQEFLRSHGVTPASM